MKVYTYSEARRRLSSLLDEARRGGEVRIRRRDGDEFLLTPARLSGSPLDVEGANLDWSREEIVAAVREGRER